ncbi:hypothetical protein N7532_008830 [Penicillium argentinense]|uniref:DBF4-type domain-containing protein n=1 Tax=Penicillium argentinense TaxID=1131581 RepID=A0A9W9EYB9_9EURO|nr:uncharacterized protein N7532_008830 [Penicillium argentinense]KAJ5090146.1 hypothetical protein N7532_008830 [Penicillium argentinense]
MSTRRPLANVPNATNSPHKAGLLPAKRARSTQMEVPYGQPPPKKQVTDSFEPESRSPSRAKSTVQQSTESRLFARRSNNANPSAFEKKLVAARDRERHPVVKGAKGEKPSADTLDTIRQWQRHYRKAFPQFVFYFDSIPEDVRRKFSSQVVALGAREENFFSRTVTHVVTSRPIPAETATSPTDESAPTTEANGDANVQTVNPSLLDKNAGRRDQGNMDVLQRARQMGMKIWALEKLQRMITTINDNDISGHHDAASRSKTAGGHTAHGKGDNALSRVLRQELLNGPSDRDPLSSMEMQVFKGPFIYIHDMNEKTKPVMVREYPRVAKRQDGAWPQFRSAPLGKCPFIDEPPSRKEMDRQRMRQAQKEKKAARQNAEETRSQSKSVSVTANEKNVDTKLVTELSKPQKPFEEQTNTATHPEITRKPSFEEAKERKSSESFAPPPIPRTGSFYTGREPAASGVQPSNVTSAIRSQMVSSTAGVPGAKAGLSKEMHGLKRKVLEKETGGIVTGSMAAPQRPINGSSLNPSRAQSAESNNSAKPEKRPREDDGYQSEGDRPKRRREDEKNQHQHKIPHKVQHKTQHRELPKKPEQRRRDPKPGYCENCREKFDDFEEHTLTRKHRRFAQNSSNWAELDSLLFELQRPLKEERI